MLSEALDFPTRGDDGARALLIGAGLLFVAGLFQLVGAVLFPLLGGALLCRIAVRGYYVRVYRRTAVDADADAPAFDDWGDLFTDGLYSLVIFLAYLLPLVVLVVLAVGGGAMSSVDDPSAAVDALRNAAGLALLLALLYFLGMWYVLPAAVTNFAYDGELRAAFRFGEVVDGAVSEDYAVGWVLTVVVQALIWPVAFLLQFLLVGFFVYFFVGVAVRSILGRSFGAARGFEPDSSDTPRSERAGRVGGSAPGTAPPPGASGVPGRDPSSGGQAETDAGSSTGLPTGERSPNELSSGSGPTGRDGPTDDDRGSAGDSRQDAGERWTTEDGRARTPAEERELFGIDDPTADDGADRFDRGDGGSTADSDEDDGVENANVEGVDVVEAGVDDSGDEGRNGDGDDEGDPLADEFTQ